MKACHACFKLEFTRRMLQVIFLVGTYAKKAINAWLEYERDLSGVLSAKNILKCQRIKNGINAINNGKIFDIRIIKDYI